MSDIVFTGEQFREQILKLMGEKDPYQWAKRKRIGKAVIERILRGVIPEIPDLVKLSRALNTTVDGLLTGSALGQGYAEEEQAYIDKVVSVLRSSHEVSKESLKNTINVYYCFICD